MLLADCAWGWLILWMALVGTAWFWLVLAGSGLLKLVLGGCGWFGVVSNSFD